MSTKLDKPLYQARRSERGVAIILVIFIVALASILVINLTYSTTLAARQNSMVERSLKAEYILKSAMNFARVLLREDGTPEDGVQDPWGKFGVGMTVPVELLGINEPNIRVYLEIRPEDAKVRLTQVLPVASGTPDQRWYNVLVRLFRQLGFDDDVNEVDTWGPTKGQHTNAEQLVARIIDYIDSNDTSYENGGIEGDLPPDQKFPNQPPKKIEELASIPGFTPARIRKLMPFATTFGQGRININFAPALVLSSLNEGMTPDVVENIIKFRESEEGPFRFDSLKQKMTEYVPEEVYDDPQTGISVLISPGSNWFQVLAKVDYGTATYFMRSYLSKAGTGALPEIVSVELY